jgi:non-heme chloroperoxidase
VRDWGSGPPVLFLSGWTLTADMWAYQMAPLAAQGLRAVAYDRRGHGRSSDPGAGYDIDTLADDLAAVIESLDLKAVTLVGHSMGGGEIARYLTRHGAGRVARVLFLAPTTPFLLKTADNPMGVDEALFAHARAAFAADFPGWLDANGDPFVVPQTSAGMRAWIKGMMLQCSMKAVLDCNQAFTRTDFRPDLARIRLPTLVIHGDADASAPLPLTGRRTAEMVPGARLIVYEGAPHGLFITHMTRLNADLLAFAKT